MITCDSEADGEVDEDDEAEEEDSVVAVVLAVVALKDDESEWLEKDLEEEEVVEVESVTLSRLLD